ncbi:hypothetical protein QJS10_CPB21g00973 [Acorus calamus]|uniref:RanBP2-type domain-containing protein n=1 Tax=Acorus calamus TaxID=4465 RepID=A0AAV9C537_ACOCL|nr:hypothetical protein QJS10_CPB21g00973 [Acorus calamus]
MSSWRCEGCTFLNPPLQNPNLPNTINRCELCLLPSSSSSSSSTTTTSSSYSMLGRWSCKACTFSNAFHSPSCEICATPSSSLRRFGSAPDDVIDIADDLDDPSVGSVFLPLRRCRIDKRAASGDGRTAAEESAAKKLKAEALPGNVDMNNGHSILKVLSYNVWFREDLEMHNRMRALGDLIQQHSPDIICFQEVTLNIFQIFRKSNWWKEYQCSVSDEMAKQRPYFCMQLSKLPIEAFHRQPYINSIMGRELCTTNIVIGTNKKLIIATTHLESPCPAPPKWDQMYSKERVAQAKESLHLLNDFPNTIFGGDMNWDDKLDGPFPLLEGWVDAWTKLKLQENGWTYDTKANKMLSANRALQKRLDRFVCRLENFKIIDIDMIGLDAIPDVSYYKEKKGRNGVHKLELPVLPSDHFGLLLTIESL